MTPINDHQTTTEIINLTKYHDVIYKKKGDEHGVTYYIPVTTSKQWTPVVRKRRKHPVVHIGQVSVPFKRTGAVSHASIDDSRDDSSVSPLSIPPHAKIEYTEIDEHQDYVLGHVVQEDGRPLQLELS